MSLYNLVRHLSEHTDMAKRKVCLGWSWKNISRCILQPYKHLHK
jgi:hypothetical protein